MSDLAIQTKKLSKKYGQVNALTDLDLKVPRNTIFGFLGPNGAGKSTTIKLLLGLIKPSDGSARVLDYDVAEQSLAVRRRIGYLAQHPSFYSFMTARRVLELSGSFFIKDQAALDRRVEEMLALVDLGAKADRKVAGFSGGEMQRLGIAQAQIHNPEVLILDEPAAALDPMGREKVLAIMEELRSSSTIFFSTHILDDVQRVSDQVAILSQGQLVAQAPTKNLLAQDGAGAYTMLTRGPTDRAFQRLEAKPWVQSVHAEPSDGLTRWRIVATDEQEAQSQLLRTALSDESLDVIEFGQEHAELEEVFIKLVNGGLDR